ncbi:hypothetical protein BOX15_Mlig012068g1 [Macrostomum lignano]|uniref:Ras-related protein Rab-11A n=2 Tax=Macrostomum lignano TaxID=282301 RepID=A0A1I8G434_9PLAT|nr:hypothetical protein BOX15_Mlig021338g1 [Macrostomum lignano]PAA90646.1 hypothetical protein BOX15_Mlig012068g1 [Macrostomum lignano]
MEYDCLFKIIVIGSSGVGKTNLISRFTKNEFRIESQTTIGVEFSNKIVSVDGRTVRCQIWDTAGQDRFRAVTKAFYRDSLGALLVFSISSRASFDSLNYWLDELRQNSSEESIVILVGNKVDQEFARQVTTTEATNFASDNGLSYLETSALDTTHVEAAFNQLIRAIYKTYSHRLLVDGRSGRTPVRPANTVQLTRSISAQQQQVDEDEAASAGCCAGFRRVAWRSSDS